MRAAFISVVVCGITLVGFAQAERSTQSPSGLNRGEIEGREELVKNRPYTATAITESIQTLADGNLITHTVEQLVARDSEGRTRHEQLLERIGSLAADAPKLIFISDPVTGKEYTLNTRDKTVSVEKRIDIEALLREAGNREPAKQSNEKPTGNSEAQRSRQVVHEDLGERTLEGFTVKGERLTATIPARTVGNARALQLSLETWYSPELHVFLHRKRIDPRFGEIDYRLTSIQRVEPDPALFKIPTGYRYVR
jgi:hypothetical protein